MYLDRGIDAVDTWLDDIRSKHVVRYQDPALMHYTQAAVWAIRHQAKDLLESLFLYRSDDLKFHSLLEQSHKSGSREMFLIVLDQTSFNRSPDVVHFVEKFPNKLNYVFEHANAKNRLDLFQWALVENYPLEWFETHLEGIPESAQNQHGSLSHLLTIAITRSNVEAYALLVPFENDQQIINRTLLEWAKNQNETALLRFVPYGDMDDLINRVGQHFKDRTTRELLLGVKSQLERQHIEQSTQQVEKQRVRLRM